MLPSFKAVATALTLFSAVAQAAVVTLDWNITYVNNTNPDGLFERRAIGINNQFPPPAINLTINDTLVINVINQIDEPTSLHAHGLFQVSNNQMDGPSMVTQCPIPPGASFTYTIPITQYGTYWIHGHNKGHYVDGLRAPLIIHNINETYHYDEEYTIAFADWYHQEHAELLAFYLSIFNPSGAEPIPNSGLINQMSSTTFAFTPGKTYRLRIINMSALSMFHFHIDGHTFDIIEVDGVDVERTTVATFPIAAAQRYSVLVTARNDTSMNYMIHGDMDPGMYDHVPPDLVLNVTGTIVYSASAPLAPAQDQDYPDFHDDTLVPVQPLATTLPSTQYVMTAQFSLMTDYINKAIFNGITYVMPKVPSLYTALSVGANFSSNAEVYGYNAHALIAKHNEWTEIVINNADTGTHPFHMHGHAFQVVGRSDGIYDGSSPYPYFNASTSPSYANPMRRDTVIVPAGTNAAIRFQATNPGVWLFHCHIEWHLQAGLAATIIEAPDVIPSIVTVDPKYYEQCKALGIPYQGNAAGNAGLDLVGANGGPDVLPGTWTAKGIVALVFTIIAALLGLVTVVWYAHDDDLALAQEHHNKLKRDALEKGQESCDITTLEG